MKEIFEQYGQAIIAFVVVILIIAILVALLATNGVVANAFKDLLNNFFDKSNSFLPGPESETSTAALNFFRAAV